jgi:hypothetical protein
MKPAVINWTAFNNEQWDGAIGVTLADGSAFDWTQYDTVAMQLKACALQPEADLSLSLGAGITVRSDDHSTIDISVVLASVQDLLGVYAYDIVGTHSGDATLVVTGTIGVNQGVTR